jgi:hypothetical protein
LQEALGLSVKEYSLLKKLKTAIFTSQGFIKVVPSTSREKIWFFFCRVVADKWKKRVFLSPSLHHWIRDFWCHADSCILYKVLRLAEMVLLQDNSSADKSLLSLWESRTSALISRAVILLEVLPTTSLLYFWHLSFNNFKATAILLLPELVPEAVFQ